MVSKAICTSRYTAIVSLTNTGKVVIKHTSLIITVSNNNLVTINNRACGNVIRRSLINIIIIGYSLENNKLVTVTTHTFRIYINLYMLLF